MTKGKASPDPGESSGPILLRGLNWLGDAVISLPALLSVKISSREDVYVLSRGAGAELYKLSPGPRRVIVDDKDFFARLSLIKVLKELQFSKAILLQNAFDAGLIAYFSRIPQSVGYNRHGRKIFLTHPVEVAPLDLFVHEIFYYLKVVGEASLAPLFSLPRLPVPSPEDKELLLLTSAVWPQGQEGAPLVKKPADPGLRQDGRQNERKGGPPGGLQRDAHDGKRDGRRDWEKSSADSFDPAGDGKKPFILALAPGASFGAAKRWPAKNFAAAAREILSGKEGMAVILGGESERDAADEVESLLKGGPRVVNLAGKTSLAGAAWIISQSGMVICNDSGVMHLAGALGVPLVAPFGPTNPLTTGPLGVWSAVLRKPCRCSPCLKRSCPLKRRICFEGLGGKEAAEAAFKLLALKESREERLKKSSPPPGRKPGQGRDIPPVPAVFVTKYIEDSFSLSSKLKMPLIFILPDSERGGHPFDIAKREREMVSPWTPWQTTLKPDATLYGHSVFFRGGETPRRFYRKLQTDWNIDLRASFWLGSDMDSLIPASLFDARIAFFPGDPASPPDRSSLLSLEVLPDITAPDFQGALDWAGALQ